VGSFGFLRGWFSVIAFSLLVPGFSWFPWPPIAFFVFSFGGPSCLFVFFLLPGVVRLGFLRRLPQFPVPLFGTAQWFGFSFNRSMFSDCLHDSPLNQFSRGFPRGFWTVFHFLVLKFSAVAAVFRATALTLLRAQTPTDHKDND
jgi:hypothetical protein